MKIIDGKKIAAGILAGLKKDLLGKRQPGLAVILIGADSASRTYIKQKEKTAKEIGALFCKYIFAADCPKKDVFDTIDWLNRDKQINGILVQLPLPKEWDSEKIIEAIKPEKDVDGLKNRGFTPPFISAIIKALESTEVSLKDKKMLALVNSDIFGKKLCAALKNKGWTAKYNIGKAKETKKADVLICACGRPKMIKALDIKKDCLLIDGGISQKA